MFDCGCVCGLLVVFGLIRISGFMFVGCWVVLDWFSGLVCSCSLGVFYYGYVLACGFWLLGILLLRWVTISEFGVLRFVLFGVWVWGLVFGCLWVGVILWLVGLYSCGFEFAYGVWLLG